MSQAFYTAIGGISAAQSKISVVADNIANMNTTAFKSSNMQFENVYSKTISTGTSPSTVSGGTNPMQVGLGVTVSSISRNFTSGTVQSTGRNTDLNIKGNGYFTLDGPDGVLFTRAGNFSLDSDGYLVSAGGIRVFGTSSMYDQNGSTSNIQIPTALNLSVSGKDFTSTSSTLTQLNNADITTGTFDLVITDGSAVDHTLNVDITGATDLNDIVAAINTAIIADGTFYDAGGPTQSVTPAVTTDGKFTLNYNSADALNGSPSNIAFVAGTSNFLSETGLSTTSADASGTYSSKVLHSVASIAPDNGSTSSVRSAFSIGNDGSIEVSYANGDKISVVADGDQKVLVYKTSTGVIIDNADITVTGGAIVPANLQLQMARVVNDGGLVSQGGNTFITGPNAGEVTFSVGNANGFGSVASGGLESSNVDLPTEFADMILSQRAIDANSRTFSAMNEIMRRIVQLGR